MIIFTAGYPFSGKTTFVRALVKQLSSKKVIHIDPASLRPPEYDTLTPPDQSKARIASWEIAQEQLTESMSESNDVVIIFDTCAANTKSMLQHFITARTNKHQIIYTFIATTIDECRKRGGAQWPDQATIDNYARNFTESVPRLCKASDRFFVIKNISNDQTKLDNIVSKIIRTITNGQIGRIRKSQSVRSTTNRSR